MTTDYNQNLLELKAVRGKEIADNYDLELLHDIEDNTEYRPCFAIGVRPDMSAGINGCIVSPWFSKDLEAWAWCSDNEAFLEGLYGENGALTL